MLLYDTETIGPSSKTGVRNHLLKMIHGRRIIPFGLLYLERIRSDHQVILKSSLIWEVKRDMKKFRFDVVLFERIV